MPQRHPQSFSNHLRGRGRSQKLASAARRRAGAAPQIRRVFKRNLTVRETEQLVEQLKGEAKVRARTLGGVAKSTHVLAVEEARAYEQLSTQFKLTQEQIAEKVGRSRAAVANSMRLLGLPGEVQSWIADNRLSVGHAKAILGLANPAEQRLVAERVLKRNLTVRETEQLVEQLKGEAKVRARTLGGVAKSTHVLAVEERLQQKLGTHVSVYHGKKKGRIEIEYYGNDDLARLLGILGIDNL